MSLDNEQEHLQHAAEHEKPGGKSHVLIYLVILFAAAFLLMLFSYLMQQRQNSQSISDLSKSVSAVQSLEELIKEKDRLEEEAGALEAQVAGLGEIVARQQAQLEAAAAQAETQSKTLAAMDYLREIQEQYALKRTKAVKALIETFEATPYVDFLPTEAVYQDEEGTVLSPAALYQSIKEAVA